MIKPCELDESGFAFCLTVCRSCPCFTHLTFGHLALYTFQGIFQHGPAANIAGEKSGNLPSFWTAATP